MLISRGSRVCIYCVRGKTRSPLFYPNDIADSLWNIYIIPLIYAVLHRASKIATEIYLAGNHAIDRTRFIHLAFNLCVHSVEIRFYPIGLHIFHE